MTRKTRGPGYVALARGQFDHPDYTDNTRLSWREAWWWLIEAAAWKPRGDRLSHGIANLGRGQAAVTIRGLASAWGWPRGNVEYFLRYHRDRERIATEVIRTKIQTKSQTKSSYQATVITICNYDKYQGSAASGQRFGVGQSFGQSIGQEMPQLPGIVTETAVQPLNHLKSDSKKEATSTRRRGRTDDIPKPRHGARNPKKRRIWFDYDTPEWHSAAGMEREVFGLEIFPRQYLGGKGFWFKERTQAEFREADRIIRARNR